MTLKLSLDLSHATLTDLTAFTDIAWQAGADPKTQISHNGSTVEVEFTPQTDISDATSHSTEDESHSTSSPQDLSQGLEDIIRSGSNGLLQLIENLDGKLGPRTGVGTGFGYGRN
ncbi:MAG: hypothetical protein SOW59_00700 [Corynebacterium sp.]|nr:hypothetical protein [Corynebacterium sp.]